MGSTPTLAAVVARAAALVTPTGAQEERLKRITGVMVRRTELAAKRSPEVRGVILGGSFAKGTWLPEEADIDIFVKVDPGVDDGTFEKLGLRIGRTAARGYPSGKKYAQHPYTEAAVDGVKVNIVPCFDVKPGEWKSAADRSQYHVKFVQERMPEGMRGEVRLLKKFMRGTGVYGAEIEKEGFSGYAAEVLVYNHGGFEGVLRQFAAFRPASKERYFSLTDPVDSERDLGRAISRESVGKMVLASRAFLRRPRLEFFTGGRRVVRAPLRRLLFAVTFEHPAMSEDTLWGELKRSTKHLVRHLEEQGFRVTRAASASDNATRSAIVILPYSAELPELEERVGPGVELAPEVESFVKRNGARARLIWVGEDGRVHTLQRRRRVELGALLGEMVKREIARVGASADVARSIMKTGRVLRGPELERSARREEWLREAMDEIASDTIGTHPGR